MTKKFTCSYCGTESKWKNSSTNTYCGMPCFFAAEKERRRNLIETGQCNQGRQLKAYLIEQHGDRCQDPECVWDFSKRPLKVELDHIDGDSTNNHLYNLRLICPNCHSLTPTYKAKNKGNGRVDRRKIYQAGVAILGAGKGIRTPDI